MSGRSHIGRRALLRGIGGVAVALPALEIMAPVTRLGRSVASADLATPPKRFFMGYIGCSSGGGVRGLDGSYHGADADMFIESSDASGYEVGSGLASLAGGTVGGVDYADVRDDVTVVNGLRIPFQTGSDVPPGGRTIEFHGNSVTPQIAGTKTLRRGQKPTAPSADQLVATAIGAGTRFPVLTYRAQPISYYSTTEAMGNGGRLSFKLADDGEIDPIDPIVSPRLAYESLFTGFTPADPADAVRARLELTRRRSVLDLVRGSRDGLLGRVGTTDRQRLERHFDEIRNLETRIDALDADALSTCTVPPHPGSDPPIGEATAGDLTDTSQYSNEDLRNEILLGLVHVAFACDLSRSVAHLFHPWKSWMNVFPAIGVRHDLHYLTHNHVGQLQEAIAWHVRHFARLVHLMRETPEVDGSRLIDHAALVLLFEGGHGYNPEGDLPHDTHSTENMSVLLAGRAGGLRAGQHVVARDRHPAEVVLTAMNACGAPGPLGDLDTPIEALLA